MRRCGGCCLGSSAFSACGDWNGFSHACGAGLRRSAAVVLITGSALALCLGFPPSAQTYFGVLSIVLAFGLAAVIIGALSDSGWYFALMEDYRDRYVWHIHPHPDLMFSSKDE